MKSFKCDDDFISARETSSSVESEALIRIILWHISCYYCASNKRGTPWTPTRIMALRDYKLTLYRSLMLITLHRIIRSVTDQIHKQRGGVASE